MNILEVNNIHKSKKKKEILKGLNFSIDENQIVGLLGPNGSGKSTTIKCIAGLWRPDSGSIKICEQDIIKDRKKALNNLGLAMEQPSIFYDLSGIDNLKMMASAKKVSKERLEEVIEFTGLGDRLKRIAGTYSMGMKMRLNLAIAILNNPNFIVLDEPTNGLDPDAVFQLREELLKLRDEGHSIMLSSHQLIEVEKIADKIVAIGDGVVKFDGSTQEIAGRFEHLEDFYKSLYHDGEMNEKFSNF